MEYQFAIIKSKYTFKKKRILTIFSFIMMFVVPGIYLSFFLMLNIENHNLGFYLPMVIIVLFFYLLPLIIFENYKIIGTIVFDFDKLTILPENTVLEIENINHIYYGYSSLYGKFKDSHNTYFLQIQPEEGQTIYLNLTRNQHNGKKFLKMGFFKRSKYIFYVFKELNINHSFKKSKNFLIQR